jgi:adenylate cyclase
MSQLSRVLGELSIYHYVRAEYTQALEFASEALSLAQQAQDPMLVAEGHWTLGFTRLCLGDYTTARIHFGEVISIYKPEQHHRSHVLLQGVDVGLSALAYDACCLWCLGFPDQALMRSQEALALARRFEHPFTLADVICYAGCMLNLMRRDPLALNENAEALFRVADEKNLLGWKGMAVSCQGEALAALGQHQEAIARINQGISINESSGVKLYGSIALRSLAKALANTGSIQAALANLAEALSWVEQTGERLWETELYRLKAELLAAQGEDSEAESNLMKALSISRRQQAKSWELLAAIDLARLWLRQDKKVEARLMLSEIYNRFTEGFDTPDLKEAKALLDELP